MSGIGQDDRMALAAACCAGGWTAVFLPSRELTVLLGFPCSVWGLVFAVSGLVHHLRRT